MGLGAGMATGAGVRGLKAAAGGPYSALTVDNQGSAHSRRTAAMTGAVDGQRGLVSFWIKPKLSTGIRYIYNSASTTSNYIRQDNSNFCWFNLRNAGNGDAVLMRAGTALVQGTWYHILASWDMGVADARRVYRNDVDDTAVNTFAQGDTVDYTNNWNTVLADAGGGQPQDCDIADLYFNFTEYLDLDVEANRRFFIDATGKPVDLGSDGSAPTGTAPIMYFSRRNGADSWADNKGTGGAFTLTGAFLPGTDSPSD